MVVRQPCEELFRLVEERGTAELARTVVAAYEGRPYHNAEHVLAMLGYAQSRSDDLELFWAIVFHDIVYIPGGTCNEELSALKAREMLPLTPEQLNKVEALIMATKHHSTEPWRKWDREKSIIVDGDLINFVKDARKMAGRIAEEFGHFSHNAFLRGRLDFLEEFGRREPFFCEPETECKFGNQARSYIREEVSRLRKELFQEQSLSTAIQA